MQQKTDFTWAVTGAGPAGIAAVGKLLDENIPPDQILWIDPEFKVGDFGKYWASVTSNTKVCLFIKFLKAVRAFRYDKAANAFPIMQLPEETTCTLRYMLEPLQWISDHLCQTVTTHTSRVQKIDRKHGLWLIQCERGHSFHAQNVILAHGAEPLTLNHPEPETIPLHTAINKDKLAQTLAPDDHIAVFGSSHSAITILNHLCDLKPKKILNFYRSPCRYALDMGEWILFDNTGLKGISAEWAKKNIDGTPPPNLHRYTANQNCLARHLPQCNKAIYAIGFQRRNNIAIEGFDDIPHNPYTGIIAPGLFGFGIGYPERKADPLGNVEEQVGLWKFMVYLDKVMPVWLRYG